jgi:3'-5' exoribonuclease
MEKRRFIKNLTEGEQVDDLFMVKSVRLAETRAGKPYLSLIFADRSGEVGGPAWDNAEALEKICVVGAVVRVSGTVQNYRDKLQLKVDHIDAAGEQTVRMDDFVAASSRNPAAMEAELNECIAGLGNEHLRKLLKKIFTRTDVGQRFLGAPAAKGVHHAYRGGLLEHSLSMARVASLLAGHYPGVDRDLVISGALLHDIGKTVELQNEVGVIDYTSIGRLKGHIVIGSEFVAREAETVKGFPRELLVHIQHLILSHHGRQEFGSPVVPMTAEAMLLSFIDDMDAKMNLVEQLRTKLTTDEPAWSDYQRILERHLLLKPSVSDPPEEKTVNESAPTRQHTLF